MKLYHGSLEIVMQPTIRQSKRTLDYGSGFYTTTAEKQAEEWVKRRLKESESLTGYINIYDFNEEHSSTLNCLKFLSPTEEWVDFVMHNRTERDFTHEYDIVFGPVANDRVYAAFALFEGGLLDKQNLISELKAYKLVDQYLFHTPAALQTLTFIEAKEITL